MTSMNDTEHSCPGCGSPTFKKLSEGFGVCGTCHLPLVVCQRCGSLEPVTAEFCSNCGNPINPSPDMMNLLIDRFELRNERVPSNELWSKPIPDVSNDTPHLTTLYGIPIVWVEKSGTVRVVSEKGAVQIGTNEQKTPNLLGPPKGYRCHQSPVETGKNIVQVGRDRALIWPSVWVTDAWWTENLEFGDDAAVIKASDLGFQRYIGVYGWLGPDRLILTGTEQGSETQIGIRVVRVTRGENSRKIKAEPCNGGPMWLGPVAKDKEWNGSIVVGREEDNVACIIVHGDRVWNLQFTDDKCTPSTYNFVLPSNPPDSVQIITSLSSDHRQLLVIAKHQDPSEPIPSTTLKRWDIKENDEVESRKLPYPKFIRWARRIWVGATPLIVVAGIDGRIWITETSKLTGGRSWAEITPPIDGNESPKEPALGPDYIVAVRPWEGNIFFVTGQIARGVHAYVPLEKPIDMSFEHNRLETAACPDFIALMIQGQTRTHVKVFALEKKEMKHEQH